MPVCVQVVVSTDSGDLMLIDSFELKGLLHHPRSGEEAHSINAIVAFAKVTPTTYTHRQLGERRPGRCKGRGGKGEIGPENI